MDAKLLTQADQVLSLCARPLPPKGLSFVLIYKGFLAQANLPATPAQTQTYTKEISGETTWVLRALSAAISSTTGIYLQIQLPNGKFLFNGLMDVLQIGGFGSWRYLFTKELECPPGSKIQITLDTTIAAPGTVQPESILFEGAYKYYITNGAPSRCTEALASQMPRYAGDANQNIMAPCWMGGVGPYVPPGWEPYTYESAVITISTTGASQGVGQAIIPLDKLSDFRCRRILFDIGSSDPSTVTGTFLAKIRAGCGYALMDDYFDVARYIGSSQWATDWRLQAGDKVYADLQLVDTGGTGSMTFKMFMEGYRGPRAV